MPSGPSVGKGGRTLALRGVGFGVLPLISMLTPLLVLPVFARSAGPAGWASAVSGEAIGALFGLVISYGWHSLGPARASVAPGVAEQSRLYRESLVVRSSAAVAVLIPMSAVCWFVGNEGFEFLTVAMGWSTALVPMSFSWFSVGAGRPHDIAVFEAIPRVAAAVVSSGVIAATGWLIVYPALAVVVPLIGMSIFSVQTLRDAPGKWPAPSNVVSLVRRDFGAAANEFVAGAYGAVPVPLVNLLSSASVAGSYSSADKLYRYGLFVPGTLANVFQRWTVEGDAEQRRSRLRRSMLAHIALGIVGCVIFAVAGPWVSALMFGDAVRAPALVCALLAVAFAFASVRTGMTRLVLFPAGKVQTILRSTLVGGVLGIPVVVVLTVTLGPAGAAAGLLASEAAMFVMLAPATRAEVRAL